MSRRHALRFGNTGLGQEYNPFHEEKSFERSGPKGPKTEIQKMREEEERPPADDEETLQEISKALQPAQKQKIVASKPIPVPKKRGHVRVLE